jgi:hypothetical protein
MLGVLAENVPRRDTVEPEIPRPAEELGPETVWTSEGGTGVCNASGCSGRLGGGECVAAT